jgi:hypothetical protein
VRRWRKSLGCRQTWQEMRAFRQRLRQTAYDFVLDTQGLLKSALITWQAPGEHLGYAGEVAREPLAARFYDRTFVIPPNAHAVERNRWLAAAACGYAPDLPLRYGEFGSCHRNEPSGALHGIMRVRGFTQDDGHIFCTEDQIQSEVTAFNALVRKETCAAVAREIDLGAVLKLGRSEMMSGGRRKEALLAGNFQPHLQMVDMGWFAALKMRMATCHGEIQAAQAEVDAARGRLVEARRAVKVSISAVFIARPSGQHQRSGSMAGAFAAGVSGFATGPSIF